MLRDVSLAVRPGEIVALLGQSGSGKSTLLNLIGSLDVADSGSIEVLGVEFDRATEKKRAHLRNRDIGFVFQSFHLLDHLSCLDNVKLPSLFGAWDHRDVEKKARGALERVGLSQLGHRTPGELSGGQKQRVAIARALLNRPKFVVV